MYGAAHTSTVNEKGIVQIAIEYLLGKLSNMSASFAEYYDGKWFDLGKDNRELQGKFTECSKTEINSINDFESIIKSGIANQKSALTNQNSFSSRSHAVFSISSAIHDAKLLLIDIAGNESSKGEENIKKRALLIKHCPN